LPLPDLYRPLAARKLPIYRLLPLLIAAVGLWSPPGASGQTQAAREPAFAVHRQPAIPLVSLRMSLLANDPPGLAGAGHLLQHLHYPRLESEAQAVGAHVRIDRTADAVVYTITGPAAELRYLATILRSTLQSPQSGEGARLTAQRDLAEERLAEWETADRHLRSALRTRLFPADISGAGTDGSAARLARQPLDEIWARMYRPDRLSVLAVGDIDLEQVRREFADLPEGIAVTGGGGMADTASLIPLAPAEATRGWFGSGYDASELQPAAVSIAARVLGDALADRLPGSEVVGEHWWTHHGQALVLMAAVPPTLVASTPGILQGLPASILSQLTDDAVAAAARAIRHDMLFYSRTPDRMAEVLGHFIDRGGDAASAQAFYAELDRVRADDVRAVLREVTAGTAIRVEIPPQKLLVNP
jgi:predicted Zn-dependent peptidase